MAKDAVDIHFEKINKRFPSTTGTDTSARAFEFLGELHQHYLLKLGVEEAQGQFLLDKAIMEEEKEKDIYEKEPTNFGGLYPVVEDPARPPRTAQIPCVHPPVICAPFIDFLLQSLTPPLPFRRTMRRYTAPGYEHQWVQ